MFRHTSTHRTTLVRTGLAAVAAMSLVSSLPTSTASADDGPRRTNPSRAGDAGAPHYLHFGPWGGLCTQSFIPGTSDRDIIEHNGGLYINGDNDADTLLELSVDDQGTTTKWDDELVVELTVAGGAGGFDYHDSVTMPYWKPGASGGLGSLGTENTPTQRSIGLVYYMGSVDVKNSVQNDTSLPMKATGWFTVLGNGADGFDGGGGPECVWGSNEDDRIFTRGGSDHVRGKYGNDLITLGRGDDTAEGGSDDDAIRGGRGDDHIIGGHGSDCYDGGRGDDLLDDQHTSSTQVDEYTVDVFGDTDVITASNPQQVEACM